MRKDVRIGMFVGLLLVAATAVYLALRPGSGLEDRVIRAGPRPVNAQPEAVEGTKTTAPADDPAARQVRKLLQEAERPSPARPSAQQPPPAGPAPAETAQGVRIHTVADGQTLSHIAQMYYGSSAQWPKILRANPNISDPDRVHPGMRLLIP